MSSDMDSSREKQEAMFGSVRAGRRTDGLNRRIIPDRIIYSLATGAPLGVSSRRLGSNRLSWSFSRARRLSASCGQCSRMSLGVSGPVPQLPCSDSEPRTGALRRKRLSPVRTVRSCTGIALSLHQTCLHHAKQGSAAA